MQKLCKICQCQGDIGEDGRCHGCRNVMIAASNGMSYGQLVALQYSKGEIRQNATNCERVSNNGYIEKVCPFCGVTFLTSRKSKKYCSADCKKRGNEKFGAIEIVNPERICEFCGNPITGKGVFYCSKECRKRAERKREKAENELWAAQRRLSGNHEIHS